MLRILPTRWLEALEHADWRLTRNTVPVSRLAESAYAPGQPGYLDWAPVFSEWMKGTRRRTVWRSRAKDYVVFDRDQVLAWLAGYRHDEFVHLLSESVKHPAPDEEDPTRILAAETLGPVPPQSADGVVGNVAFLPLSRPVGGECSMEMLMTSRAPATIASASRY